MSLPELKPIESNTRENKQTAKLPSLPKLSLPDLDKSIDNIEPAETEQEKRLREHREKMAARKQQLEEKAELEERPTQEEVEYSSIEDTSNLADMPELTEEEDFGYDADFEGSDSFEIEDTDPDSWDIVSLDEQDSNPISQDSKLGSQTEPTQDTYESTEEFDLFPSIDEEYIPEEGFGLLAGIPTDDTYEPDATELTFNDDMDADEKFELFLNNLKSKLFGKRQKKANNNKTKLKKPNVLVKVVKYVVIALIAGLLLLKGYSTVSEKLFASYSTINENISIQYTEEEIDLIIDGFSISKESTVDSNEPGAIALTVTNNSDISADFSMDIIVKDRLGSDYKKRKILEREICSSEIIVLEVGESVDVELAPCYLEADKEYQLEAIIHENR